MDGREFTLREWIEAALQIGKPTCEIHQKTRLQLVWVGDEDNLVTWYIECPKKGCNREYSLLITFYPLVIPESNYEIT